jgi:hypothetical protein
LCGQVDFGKSAKVNLEVAEKTGVRDEVFCAGAQKGLDRGEEGLMP